MDKILYYIIGVVILFAAGFIALQFRSFRDWLIYAVTQAELYFGGKTGQLKLRYVYDMAVERFRFITVIITFDMFSKFVDKALIKMRDMIANNQTIGEMLNNVKVIDIDD